ncbi:RING finger protein 37-like [Rhopilema esculentum]|uniref:RING finger protein 37-like n=1 Tax=Rhopilema esculentum TaxID=499914 RepID=UPI0031DA3DC6|eukprot:gene12205-2830_t
MASCIDFANKDYGTTAYTNVVSADGFEVSNLLEKTNSDAFFHTPRFSEANDGSFSKHNGMTKAKNGFMADYFTKPPVDVVIQFPCLVDVDSLVINCKSGEKKVAEFIVSVANAKPPVLGIEKSSLKAHCKKVAQTKLQETENISPSSDSFPLSYEPDFSLAEVRKSNLSSLHLVGKFNSKINSFDTVIFRNPRSCIGKGNDYLNSGKPTLVFFSLPFLLAVSHLIIRVFKTESSTAVALKNVEVWGRPSRSNKNITKSHITKISKRIMQKNYAQDSGHKVECEKTDLESDKNSKRIGYPTKETLSNRLSDNSFCAGKQSEIPDEFLDPITFEIMLLPILLPSGHSVDLSTLERCTKEDEKNGRMAMDPFTGVPLNQENKAVPNTALKYRLDSFMLKKKSEVFQRQTTGVDIPSSDVTGNIKNLKRISNYGMSDKVSLKKVRVSSLLNSAKSKCELDSVSVISKYQGKDSTDKIQSDKQLAEQDSSINSECSISSKFSEKEQRVNGKPSHEELLKNSLESALQKVVWPYSLKIASDQESNKRAWKCCLCRTTSTEKHFFKIPCNHLVCRDCLMKDQAVKKCGQCLVVFKNHEVARVHFTAYFDT